MINNRCPGNTTHKGMDIANAAGTAIYATQDGTITTGYDGPGYGNYLVVTHSNGWSSLYGHIQNGGFVRTSGTVRQGELIGKMGATGDATGNHLHFEMRLNGTPQNFNSATSCGAHITGLTPINYNFSGLNGSGPAYEAVTNGGGTRIIGPNAYMDVSSTGQVYAWNGSYWGGSPAGYTGRIVDAKVTANDAGYWLLSSAGQIYAYGNAPYKGGSPAGYTGEIVAMAATPDGQGYVMVSSAGQIYAYGTAGYFGGSPAGYSGNFVDVEMTPDGGGYWLLTSAGQIYAYGNAQYYGGSPTGFDRAIVAMSRTADGGGYVMVSKTGQVYAYGNAAYMGGSPAGIGGEIADISYRPDGTPGYLMISTSGGHYAYNTPWIGNPSGFAGIF